MSTTSLPRTSGNELTGPTLRLGDTVGLAEDEEPLGPVEEIAGNYYRVGERWIHRRHLIYLPSPTELAAFCARVNPHLHRLDVTDPDLQYSILDNLIPSAG